MSLSQLLDLIEKSIGQRPSLSPESHLPSDLHFQRFMVPPHDEKARYHAEEGKITALNLSGLNLGKDQLSFLEKMNDLKALNLSNNSLSSFQIPKNLSGLEYLELSDHKALASVIFPVAFPQLKRLNLSNSGIESLTFQEGFSSLEILELQKNKLKKLDLPAGFGSLIFLDLKDNEIATFKAEDEFPKLYTLYLENNKLTEIDKGFLTPFPNLARLRLEDNPLHESILANISENSTETLAAIRRYIADLGGGTEMDKECKVLLLGNGSVGKTCMVQRMVHNTFMEDWHSTHAISLDQYPNTNEAERTNLLDPYTLNLWDFGGQDIYHATHRLFMQANAVYLLLWNKKNREEDKTYLIEDGEERSYDNHSLEYWLSYAKSQGKGSPAIVVQTYSGEELQDKEKLPGIMDSFDKDFPMLAFEHVESKEDDWKKNGYKDLFGNLKKAVELIKEDSKIPTYWAKIRDEIRQQQKADIKRMELQDFYALAKEVEEPLDVLRWLTQSGALFYKEGLFNDEIILDQAWAIEAIYTLFDRNEFYYKGIEKEKGKFSGKDLTRIWKKEKKAKSEAEMELFVSFMLSCELCFETTPKDKERYHVPFAERTFIAPQLLPPKEGFHDRQWWKGEDYLHVRFEHDFLHYGVIQSFIVRAQKLAKAETLWKTGILLTEGTEQIQVEAWEKKVEIRASVKSSRLLSIIRKELTELQEHKAKESVSLDGIKYVFQQKLEKQISRGKNQEIECINGGFVEIAPFRPYFQKLYGLREEGELIEQILVEKDIFEETKEEEKTFELLDKGLPKVYFSYAWGDSKEKGKSREDIVDTLYDALAKEKNKYQLLRDKKNIEYGGLISEFMKKLGEGDLIVVFVSEKYARSEYCMFELCEIARNNFWNKSAFTKHILPVRLASIAFDKPETISIYFNYWEEQLSKWENLVKKFTRQLSEGQTRRYHQTNTIFQNFGKLVDWLADINSSNHELLSKNDYQRVKNAIEKRLSNK